VGEPGHRRIWQYVDHAGGRPGRQADASDTGAVAGIRRQAEFATIGGGATVESSSLGFAGNGYVNLPTTGGYVTFPVTGSWNDYRQMALTTSLSSGTTNTVKIQSTGQDGVPVIRILAHLAVHDDEALVVDAVRIAFVAAARPVMALNSLLVHVAPIVSS
jgi:hypothetical protein